MKTLVIEIFKEIGQLKISVFYKTEGMAHRQYTVQKISEDGLGELCSDIFQILNRIDLQGKVADSSFEEFRKSASLLYNKIFPSEIKDALRNTDATHLIFSIDEQLVNIPWELLHDGYNFLCLRFATGRIVITSQKIRSEIPKITQQKLKIIAVCDPEGNLRNAYEEGISIRKEMDKSAKKVHLDLKTTEVDAKYVLKNLSEYDAFHFAGHAKYDEENPSRSGLILKDGMVTAEEICGLSDSAPLPLFVFINGCGSGGREEWRIDSEQENRIYGLANAFLISGVKYYIGTFWGVHDRLSMEFARFFYHNIRNNKTIGDALRQARLYMVEKYGRNALVWASYMLYGDSGGYLMTPIKRVVVQKVFRPRNLITAVAGMIMLGFITGYNLFSLKDEKPLKELQFKPMTNVFYVKQDGMVEEHDQSEIFNRNIALGKKMYASSFERNAYIPDFAADHNFGTRWSSMFSDLQWIYVDLGENTPIGQIRIWWQMAFACSYEIQVSDDAKIWKTVWKTSQGGEESNVIDLRGRNIFGRYIRVYCKKRGTDFGYSVWEFEVYPDHPPDIARGKKAFVSSGHGLYGPDKAVDGDIGTRWGSDYSDPQWLYIDLGKEYKVSMVTIEWENAFAKIFKIQRSDDGKNWLDVCEIGNDTKKENNIYFKKPFFARYVRMYGIERASDWGYSIWEMRIHGIEENQRN